MDSPAKKTGDKPVVASAASGAAQSTQETADDPILAELDDGDIKQAALLFHAQQFQGPLPLPDILRGYEQCCEGAANRIIKMAEDEVKNRHSLTSEAASQDRLGLCFSFIFLLVAVAMAAYLAAIGATVAACFIISGVFGTTTGLFAIKKWRDARMEQRFSGAMSALTGRNLPTKSDSDPSPPPEDRSRKKSNRHRR